MCDVARGETGGGQKQGTGAWRKDHTGCRVASRAEAGRPAAQMEDGGLSQDDGSGQRAESASSQGYSGAAAWEGDLGLHSASP